MSDDKNDNAPTEVDLRGPPTLGASEAGALGLSPTIALAPLSGEASLAEDAPRYGELQLIAEGGMGEVHLCRDLRVGRDVAMKVVHPRHRARRDLEVRFLREARVQGQLEHPSIVPVYDIGRDAAGNLYFTMKRIPGTTLEDVLGKLRKDDPEAQRAYPRHRLLASFASLSQAVHYAHVRGVVHRDLKPANVALGSFGEVYVLDWGLAKIAEDKLDAPRTSDVQSGDGKTEVGSVLGTPGYMAPEQAAGAVVDARTDVFALGAILFELLTGTALLGDGTIAEIMARTVRPIEARPSVRAPNAAVPPELETICVRATASDPDQRYATAGALFDAIDRYLAGDRDLELRRSIASEHIERARKHASSALAGGPVKERELALKEAGQAAAVDPTNPDAVRILLKLLTEAPKVLPQEVVGEMERVNRAENLRFAPIAALACASVPLFAVPIYALMGVLSWAAVAASMAFWVAGVVWLRTAPGRLKPETAVLTIIVLLSCGIGGMSIVVGSLVVVPTIAVVFTMAGVITAKRRLHALVIALGCATIFLPLALEWAGVVVPAYRFEDGAITIVPRAVALARVPAMILLLVGQLITLILGSLIASFVNRQLAKARERVYVQAWQFRALAPAELKSDLG